MATQTITASAKQTQSASTTIKRLTSSCQQIVSEDFSKPTAARVVVRSNLSDPQILPIMAQHKCHEVALTPSLLYVDMATVVAEYIWRGNRGQNAVLPGINVCNMDVVKTYIITLPQPKEGEWLEMECATEVSEYSSKDILDASIRCTFRRIKPDGTKMHDLAYCNVHYEFDPGWLAYWSDHAPLINTKINNLHARALTEATGDIQHMYKDKAYKLFKTFVDYGPKYQNMAEVVVDTKTLEGTATLAFQPDPATDYTYPFYLDGSCHISGFICNAIEDTEKNAWISNGIDAMKFSPKFQPTAPGAVIRNYVRMQPLPADKTVMTGDVYVLQNDEIVALCEGAKFKKIPRRALNVFLPKPKKT